MKRIVFVVNNLACGGVTAALENLINEIQYEFEIYIISLDNGEDEYITNNCNAEYIKVPKCFSYLVGDYTSLLSKSSKWEFPLIVFCKFLSRFFGSKRSVELFSLLFSVNKEFDYAVAFTNDIFLDCVPTGGANALVLNSIHASKKITWIHNDPVKYRFSENNSKKTFSRFDVIVNVSYACKRKFDEIFPYFIDKSFVVWNMSNKSRIDEMSCLEPNPFNMDKFNIVTVARLDNQQKRLDRVVKCCEYLCDNNYTNFEWTIVGEGPDRESIESAINKSSAREYIKMVGQKDNPYPYMKNADLFVLCSDYESFGIVVSEAMLLKCPVLTTNYEASHEIIDDGVNGFICENDDLALQTKLLSIVCDNRGLNVIKERLGKHLLLNEEAKQQFKCLLK